MTQKLGIFFLPTLFDDIKNCCLHLECVKEVVNQPTTTGSPDDIQISMAEEAREEHRPSFDISSRLEHE